MANPGPIDPTKPGKYPIILSDALLGKPSKEAYTGVRYNHKPALSSETAPATARLKKSAKDGGSFNIGFDDNGGRYQYNGTRTTEDDQYVLIFDPARQAFVLHRVDSMFHMNLTKTPTDSNVESLRKQFPHLEVKSSTPPDIAKPTGKKGKAAEKAGTTKAAKGKAGAAKDTTKATKAKAEKNKGGGSLPLPDPSKNTQPLPLPTPAPAKSEPKKSSKGGSVDSEEEEEDEEDPFVIEYPGSKPPTTTFQPLAFEATNSFSPAFPSQRRFSEFYKEGDQEDEDADAEGEDDPVEDADVEDSGFGNLPSPINNQKPAEPVDNGEISFGFEADLDAEGEEDEDMDAEGDANEVDADAEADPDFGDGFADLEAELEAEFAKVEQDQKGNESDSSVSEEE